jgi:hypothetical protein
LPPPQRQPHPPRLSQAEASPAQPASLPLLLLAEANTDNFFKSLTEPQCGHGVPFQLLERTRISLSLSHFAQ